MSMTTATAWLAWLALGAAEATPAAEAEVETWQEHVLRSNEDPRSVYNWGVALYRAGRFDEAERAFARAAERAHDPALRARARFNEGNSRYRGGKLPDAVKSYEGALEQDPKDGDARHNLELVRREIEQRRDQQRNQPPRQDEQQQQAQQQEGQSGAAESAPQGAPQQEQGQHQQGQPQPHGQEPRPPPHDATTEPAGGSDRDEDNDGLADELERAGMNPTDPKRADTDGDGVRDGDEDRNRNGRVDAGETDPTRMDTDGDGVPDRASTATGDGTQAEQDAARMDKELARRRLDALSERRPAPATRRARARGTKDW